MATRKDFRAVAAAIKDELDILAALAPAPGPEEVARQLVKAVARGFQRCSDRFDWNRFMDTCGYPVKWD